MSKCEAFLEQLYDYETSLEEEIKDIEQQLDVIGREQRALVVKTIQGKKYYYEQWRENNRLISRSVGRALPGVSADVEIEREQRKELLQKLEEDTFLLNQIKKNIAIFTQKEEITPIIPDYAFEVYWKDELVTRVQVLKSKVKISRYTLHPAKQIFSEQVNTQYQVNKILEMRCFEKGRSDVKEKLSALGIDEYNPYEIVKKTHGVSYNDYLWFRFPKEKLTSKDVLVRK